MKTYIKITEPGFKNGFVDTPDEAKKVIDQMIRTSLDCGESQSYTFTTIEMSEDEFESLPEFQGF